MEKRVKTGGRQKGVRNRVPNDLKEKVKTLVFDELESLNEYLDKLEPKERLDIVVRLLPYVIPKQQTIEVTDKTVVISFLD